MLKQLKWKIEKANNIIEEMLSKCNNSYIAFSTGKDSTVVLDLVMKQNKNISIVYFDADAKFPECEDVLQYYENKGLKLIRFKTEPLIETIKKYGFNNSKIEYYTMQSTVYKPIKRMLKKYKYDGVFLGLRAEESFDRKRMLKIHGILFYQKRDKIWECNPIGWWTKDDVWQYIDYHNCYYNKIYDKNAFQKREDMRVSYCYGETFRTCGRIVFLKHYYPNIYNKFVKEIPEISQYA